MLTTRSIFSSSTRVVVDGRLGAARASPAAAALGRRARQRRSAAALGSGAAGGAELRRHRAATAAASASRLGDRQLGGSAPASASTMLELAVAGDEVEHLFDLGCAATSVRSVPVQPI